MKILVICAHPDDETLGLGGTIALHSSNKDEVYVLIFADGESARGGNHKRIEQRRKQAQKACSILGVKKVEFLAYDDQKLDIIPLVELARNIESVIKKWKPNVVYTHFWGDVNQDHRQIFEAASIAVRPIPSSNISRFVCFETPSSTEWGNTISSFNPNLFVDISNTMNKKNEAFLEYKNEVMKYPHPRSEEAVINRAKYWGSCVGIQYAEALLTVREIYKK